MRGLEAICTDHPIQLQGLQSLLGEIEPVLDGTVGPVALGTLIRLVGLVSEPELLELLRHYIVTVYPDLAKSGSVEDIAVLKYLAQHRLGDQAKLAKQLLSSIRRHSLGGGYRVRRAPFLIPVAGDPWWEHNVLPTPQLVTESTEPLVRLARDAREALLGGIAEVLAPRTQREQRTDRAEFHRLVKELADQSFAKCPICNVDVRPKNLLRHYDKVHKGEAGPSVSNLVSIGAAFPEDSISRPIHGDSSPGVEPFEREVSRWPKLLPGSIVAAGVVGAALYLHVTEHPLFTRSMAVLDTGIEEVVGLLAPPAEVAQPLMSSPSLTNPRIAYASEIRMSDGSSNWSLNIADQDGNILRTIEESPLPIASPSWSPDGERLAYMSLDETQITVHVRNLTSGELELSIPGGVPAWSPDGSQLALISQEQGNFDIYIYDIATERRTQLIRHIDMDTEPAWAPDGQSLVFTSHRSGGPQIYQIPVTGGEPKRLTFVGYYNARASFSPDGSFLTLVHNSTGSFSIALFDLQYQTFTFLTDGANDYSPRFSPDGRRILYQTTDANGGDRLAIVSVDGRVNQALPLQTGKIFESTWSPFFDELSEDVVEAAQLTTQASRKIPDPMLDNPSLAGNVGQDDLESQKDATQSSAETSLSPASEELDSNVPVVAGSAQFSRNEIRETQRLLLTLGHDPGPIDGLWGGKTRRAMQAFQAARGLSITTELDRATFEALRGGHDAPVSEEERRRQAVAELQRALAEEEAMNQVQPQLPTGAMVDYLQLVREKIMDNWRLEPFSSTTGLTCRLLVTQNTGGEVTDVKILRSSGNVGFDLSAVVAVNRASRLPLPSDPSLFAPQFELEFVPGGG